MKRSLLPLARLLLEEDEPVRRQGRELIAALSAEDLLRLLQEMASDRRFERYYAFQTVQLLWIRRQLGAPPERRGER